MADAITDIETIPFEIPFDDLGTDETTFNIVYDPGNRVDRKFFAIRIRTREGHVGEYVDIGGFGENGPEMAQVRMMTEYLIGRDPANRERHWSEIGRGFRKYDRMGVGPIDIALWDLAGRKQGVPIHALLGSYRDRLPAYASTLFGDHAGGLDSPTAYADFAEECLDLGYPAFKMHGWGPTDGERDIDREIETVHALGERVGDEMDLMLDPGCEYPSFAEAIRVGRALDEEGFFWYEDPLREGGRSIHAHRELRRKLDTSLLQGEFVRGLSHHADLIANGGTDFARADPEYDMGITGAMKIAHLAEGFGIDVEFHSAGPAHRHCMAATQNTNYYEVALVHPDCRGTRDLPVYADGYAESLTAINTDGTVPVPDGPGLGVEYDWDYIEDHRIDG